MHWRSLLLPFVRSADASRRVVDPARLRRMQWRVFVAITFGYGFFYVCRLSLNVVKKPLIDGGRLDAAELGLIGSSLFAAYAVGRLVNGVLVDHANVRRFMAFGLLASAAINVALGNLPGFWVFAVLWSANGWFQSVGAPSSVVAMARWFPARQRGTVYGVWSTSHNIGEAFTYLVTGAIVAASGAAWGLRAAGVVGAVAGLAILAALPERPEVHGLVAPDADTAIPPAATRRDVAARQWRVAGDPRIWLLAVASGLFYVTRYAINSWGIFFLQEAKGYGALEASAILSVNALAGIGGTFFSGIVSDRFFGGDRYRPALVAGLLFVATTAAFVLGPANPALDTAVMVGFGIAMGALLAYLGGMMALDLVGREVVGTATAIVGIASYLGAALQDVVSGALIQAGRGTIAGRAHYDFSSAAWLWIAAAAASCVTTQLVRFVPRRR